MTAVMRIVHCLQIILLLTSVDSFAQRTSFAKEHHPEAPSYSDPDAWSALPFRTDAADAVPGDDEWIPDSLKDVDVFYVHPTIYINGPQWNAGLDMKNVNRKVDKYPVRLQASVFNESCRVYAPRYRQAVAKVFYEPSEDGDAALDLAYSDVKRAFIYYLDHYNHGRPFIIAGHSQGSLHARRLLREMVDTTVLGQQMVAAYIIGYTVNQGMFTNLKLCQNATDNGCYITWQSYREGFKPSWDFNKGTESVNPLTWSTDTEKVTVEDYTGTVVLNPKHIRKRPISVRITHIGGNVLWVDTKEPWFRMMKNLHVADYGLFYMDIRRNVKQRIASYRKQSE